MQSKLRDQALSLAGRLERRELTEENQEFSDFQKDMNAAAGAMGPAAESCRQHKWADAIPDEQRALQHLLRAEATFRQIEVAFGSRGGGGGGGGGGAGRDLSSLFDLELDTEKNQYETGQTASSDAQQRAGNRRRRCRSSRNWRAASKNWRTSRTAASRASSSSAGSRRCCAAKPRNCSGRWSRWPAISSKASPANQVSRVSRSGKASRIAHPEARLAQSGSQGSAAQRAQQALDRLREANDDMRRAASQGQQGRTTPMPAAPPTGSAKPPICSAA